MTELQEISRGIHPAILSNGGLGPALETLARRCAVPVELAVNTNQRLAEPVEVAAYYIVSEAFTNTTKYAHASAVHVTLDIKDTTLRLSVRDDGDGGADPNRGSGLTGLRDRIEALNGTIEITSPPGHGTSLTATIPINYDLPATHDEHRSAAIDCLITRCDIFRSRRELSGTARSRLTRNRLVRLTHSPSPLHAVHGPDGLP
jgi:signal transduction histidine kinase